MLADQHASSDAPLEQQEPNKDVSLEHANQNVSPDSHAVADGETLHHKTPIDEQNNSSLGSTDMTAAMHDDDDSDQIINVTKALEQPGQI